MADVMKFESDLGKFPEHAEEVSILFEQMTRDAKMLSEAFGSFQDIDTKGIFSVEGELEELISTIKLLKAETNEQLVVKVRREFSDDDMSGILTKSPTTNVVGIQAKSGDSPAKIAAKEAERNVRVLATIESEMQKGIDADKKEADLKIQREKEVAAHHLVENAKRYSANEVADEKLAQKQLEDEAELITTQIRNNQKATEDEADKLRKLDIERQGIRARQYAADHDAEEERNQQVLANVNKEMQAGIEAAKKEAEAYAKSPQGISEKYDDKVSKTSSRRDSKLNKIVDSHDQEETNIKYLSGLRRKAIHDQHQDFINAANSNLTLDKQGLAERLENIDRVFNRKLQQNDKFTQRDLDLNKKILQDKLDSTNKEYDFKIGRLNDTKLIEIKNVVGVDAIKGEVDAKRARIFAAHNAEQRKIDADAEAAADVKKKATKTTVGDLNSSLGGVKGNFSQQGMLNIVRANQALEKFINNSKISNTRITEIFGAIVSKNTQVLAQFSKEEQELEIKLRSLQTAFAGAASKTDKFNKILLTTSGMIRLVEVQFMHKAISNVMESFTAAKDKYLEMEKGIALINTISQKATRSTEAWAASLTHLSSTYGIDILDATAAAYEAISNQIAQGAAITPFLAQSFEFARSTASSAKDSVNLLSSALNAYNLGTQSTERVSSVLFKTIELGRVKASEMANTFGNTARLASSLGVNIEELGAGLSTLTIQGIRYDTSATLMNNIILKLLKPTKEMKGLLEEWGVSSGEAAVATFGFGGVLQKLNAEFNKGGLTRLGELEGDLRAIRAAAGLTANGAFDNFNKNVQAMSTSLGEYRESVRLTSETLEFKLNVELQKLNNAFITVVGKRFNENILSLNESVGGLADELTQLGLGAVNTIKYFGGILSITTRLVTLFGVLENNVASITPALAAYFVTYKTGVPLMLFAFNASARLATAKKELKALNLADITISERANVIRGVSTATQIAEARTVAASSAAKAAGIGPTTGLTAATAGLVSMQSALLFGLPLVAAGLTWLWYSSVESAAEVARAGDDVLQEHSKAMIKIAKEEAFVLDQESKKFEKALNDQSQKLNQYVSVFRQGMGKVAGEFKNLNDEANTQKFTDSLIGKEGVQKLELVADRIKDIGVNTEKLTIAQKFEEAEKSLESLNKLMSDFKKEQDGIIKNASKKILGLETKRDQKQFEDKLSGLSDPAKVGLLTAKIAGLRKEAQTLFNNKEFEAGNAKLEEAAKFAEKVINITEKKGGKSKGGGLLDAVEQDQINAQKLIIANAETIKIAENPDEFVKGMTEKIAKQKEFNELITQVTNGYKELTALQASETQKFGDAKTKSSNAVGDVKKSVADLIANLNQVTPQRTISDGLFSMKGRRDMESEGLYTAKLSELKALQKELIKETSDQNGPINQNAVADVESRIKAKLIELRTLIAALQQKGLLDSEAKLGDRTMFERLSDTSKSLEGSNSARGDLTKADQSLKNIEIERQRLDALVAGPMEQMRVMLGEKFPETMKQAAEATKSVIFELNTSITTLGINIQNLATIMNKDTKNVPAGGGGGRALGGLMGYAGGGFLRGRVGRDNLLVKAHANEFMVNAEAAARFTPELVAMNSGYSNAQGFNNGGPITNVGGITVNAQVNKGAASQDVVALGRALEREIGRGTINLNPRRR